MADERQERLEARARIDIRKFYEKGTITLKDHASAVGYLRGVWFDHLSDVEIEDFIEASPELTLVEVKKDLQGIARVAVARRT